MQRNILVSILPLVISVMLIVVVAKVGIGRVVSLREEISQAEKDKATLTEKLDTLSSLSANLQNNSQLSSYALPDSNPALPLLYQVKALSNQSLITVSKIRGGSGNPVSKELSRVSLTFDFIGPREGVLSFISSFNRIAPIVSVDKIKFAQGGEAVDGTMTVSSYWAPYPTKLPSLITPISSLTQDEVKTLTTIASLVPPQFLSIPPSTSGGKVDPFSQ